MTPRITHRELVLYFRGELDRRGRLAVETACETDAEVRRLYDGMKPTEAELLDGPMLSYDPLSPAVRSLVGPAADGLCQDEQVDVWMEWLREPTLAANSPELKRRELVCGPDGLMLYRDTDLPVAAGNPTLTVHDLPTPCLLPNYEQKVLHIRQALDQVPGGLIDVIAVRRRTGERPRVRRLERVQLNRSKTRWWADLSLHQLLGDYRADEDVIYGVVVPRTSTGGK